MIFAHNIMSHFPRIIYIIAVIFVDDNDLLIRFFYLLQPPIITLPP